MKKARRIFSCLCLMLLLFNSLTVSAQELTRERQPVEINTTEGLDSYIHWNADGKTIYLDAVSARDRGYTNNVIQISQINIEQMNKLVRQGYVINDDFSMDIYINKSSGKNLLRAVRGQSKVVVWATGMVLVYMNNVETNDLYNSLGKVGAWITLSGIIPYLLKSKEIISEACGAALFVGGVSIVLYQAQINQVRKNGTGIIMYVAPLPDGGTSVSFGAQ